VSFKIGSDLSNVFSKMHTTYFGVNVSTSLSHESHKVGSVLHAYDVYGLISSRLDRNRDGRPDYGYGRGYGSYGRGYGGYGRGYGGYGGYESYGGYGGYGSY
jgi:hypothetical protein